MNSDELDYVKFRFNNKLHNTIFLHDMQAQMSIIKLQEINNRNDINNSQIYNIKGATGGVVKTLGFIILTLNFTNFDIGHKFHVVPDDFDIPLAGVIGRDLINSGKCNLDYDNREMIIKHENLISKEKILLYNKKNSHIIPARSEIILKFEIDAVDEVVIDNRQINDDVFISRTIVDPKDAYLRVLNISNTDQIISKEITHFESLNNFYIYTIDRNNDNSTRTEEILKLLSKENSKSSIEKVKSIINEFNDIFALEYDTMSVNNFYEQKLKVKNAKSVYIKNYRTPHAQKQEIKSQVDKLLNNNLIESSISSFNSPVILVPKKTKPNEMKKFRMCIDYRAVNKQLIPDKFPLPRIEDILDRLGRAKYFSVVDLYSGFHQVPLEKNSRDITSFSTEEGSFRWKVLPFGLNISPNSFSRMMNIAFSGLSPDKMFVYIDDIIIIGCSEEHHLRNLNEVFTICRKRN